MPPSPAVLTDSKWIEGISPDQPVCEVASQVLAVRLKAVCQLLPLAATKSDEDVEHVHRLRISARRAVEALRVFSGLIDERLSELQERLRQIRLAADEARNWDVMAQWFSQQTCDGILLKILEQITALRRKVQEPILAIHLESVADCFEEEIGQLIQDVASHRHSEGKQQFGCQVRRYLAPAVKKFVKAAESDLSNEDALHALRIRSKKLRYTMEIVAVAFDSGFRWKLYPQVTLLQGLLGAVNDHTTAKTLFQDWLSKAEDAEQKAFFEGLLLMEKRATEDLKAAFLASWRPTVVSDLKRRFQAYC